MSDSPRVVTILGGYGIFGGRVAEALAHDPRCRVRVVGRNPKVGGNFAHRIGAESAAGGSTIATRCGGRSTNRSW